MRFITTSFFALSILFGIFILGGCDAEPETPLGPPAGWEGVAGQWWQTGFDTTDALPDLSSFEAIGYPLEEVIYSQGDETVRQQIQNSIQEKLFPMYQNAPRVVDSLFNKYGRPKIEKAKLGGAYDDQVKQLGARIYKILNRHFRQPYPKYKLGSYEQAQRDPEIIRLVYPDSLRDGGIGGKVRMQVYLNTEGEPQAIRVLESVHPVLDEMAMLTLTQMRWYPIYLHGKAIAGPALYNINFRVPAP